MATDFGVDISALPDLDPSFSLRSGQRVVAEAIARRLQTPRGSLIDSPNYGIDLRAYLNESLTQGTLVRGKADIESECRKDERIFSCSADLTLDTNTSTMRAVISCVTSDGPFTLVLSITAVSVVVLQGT